MTDVKFGVFENESKQKYSFVRDADIFFMTLVKSTLEQLSYSIGVLLCCYLCLRVTTTMASTSRGRGKGNNGGKGADQRKKKKNVTTTSHLILATLLPNFVLVGYVPMIIWREHYSSMFTLTITLFHISASLIALYTLNLSGDCTRKVINVLLAMWALSVGHVCRFIFQDHFLDHNDPVTYQSLFKRIHSTTS